MHSKTWRMIIESTKGKMFTCTFIKRTTKEKRVMNCRLDVQKGIVGTGSNIDFKANNLIPVFDMKADAWRSISLEAIIEVKAGGHVYSLNENGTKVLVDGEEYVA